MVIGKTIKLNVGLMEVIELYKWEFFIKPCFAGGVL